MAYGDTETIVGFFTDRGSAERARGELASSGVRRELIDLRSEESRPLVSRAADEVPDNLRAKGTAEIGGIIGGIVGCLLGTLLATGVVPGIPLLLGGGAGGGTLGALIGLAVGAIAGALIGWGMAADRESFYAREMRAGKTVLTVSQVAEPDEINAILRRHGAVHVNATRRAVAQMSH